MDDLDRLYRRLVHNIRTTRPEYLQIPFTVQELYEQIIPYRHNRRELAMETNQDYEMAVARLLSGERGYAQGDAAMQEVLRRELESPTGDPGIFKEYAQAQIALAPVRGAEGIAPSAPAPAGVDALAGPPTVTAPRPGVATGGTAGGATTTAPNAAASTAMGAVAAYDAMAPGIAVPSATASQVPSLLSSLSQITVPMGCRFCGGTLPDGRDINYCPHCGENLKTLRCPACGGEMDNAWKFCVTCGRRAG